VVDAVDNSVNDGIDDEADVANVDIDVGRDATSDTEEDVESNMN
jgi:hypothetical protein